MSAQPPRAFLLQNGLRTGSSHFLQETEGWLLNLKDAGFAVELHGNVAFGGESVAGVPVQRSFNLAPDSSVEAPALFRKLRTFVEGSAQFSRDCRALHAADPGADDLIVVPYATDVEMMGVATWLKLRKSQGRPLPFVAVLMHRPDYEWRRDPETGALIGDLSAFAYACHTLHGVAGPARLALLTTTQAFARVLEETLGLPVAAGCAPLHYRPLSPPVAPRWDVAFLGQMRPEKGSRILAGIISGYLAARPQARIAVQCDSPREPEAYLDGYHAIADDPRITWRMGAQDAAGFADMLDHSGCILLPVEPTRYQLRISGVFCEALGAARPVVVSDPTWMTDMLRAGHGAGIAVRNPGRETFVRALLHVAGHRAAFEERARQGCAAWRREQSLERLVALIGARMAAG